MNRVKRSLLVILSGIICMSGVLMAPLTAAAAASTASPTTTGAAGRTPFTGAPPAATPGINMAPLLSNKGYHDQYRLAAAGEYFRSCQLPARNFM
jgi:hypothetical protein